MDGKIMKVGDLIKLKAGEYPRNNREVGTVLKLEIRIHTRDQDKEEIAEVLWDTGKIGWILSKRTEVISESR